jgi:hypothetical protein
MATNEKNFLIKKGLTVGDGIIVEDGVVDFRLATSVLGIDLGIADPVNIGSGAGSTSSTTETVIYQFTKAEADSAELVIRAKDTTDDSVQITKMLIVHDGTTATATEYGETLSGSALASYDVAISGTHVQLKATAASSNQTSYVTGYTLITADTLYVDSASTSATSQTVLYSFAHASHVAGEFVITAVDGVTGEVHLTKLLVVHDGTTATATEYGQTGTDSTLLASYDVDINGANCRILATPTSSNAMTHRVKYELY